MGARVLSEGFAATGAGAGTAGMAGMAAAAARVTRTRQVRSGASGERTRRGHDFGRIGRAATGAGQRGIACRHDNLAGVAAGLASDVINRHVAFPLFGSAHP